MAIEDERAADFLSKMAYNILGILAPLKALATVITWATDYNMRKLLISSLEDE